MEVKVHEAKTHLSRLLQRVEAGEEITIARGETPIARLVPIAHAAQADARHGSGQASGCRRTSMRPIRNWKLFLRAAQLLRLRRPRPPPQTMNALSARHRQYFCGTSLIRTGLTRHRSCSSSTIQNGQFSFRRSLRGRLGSSSLRASFDCRNPLVPSFAKRD